MHDQSTANLNDDSEWSDEEIRECAEKLCDRIYTDQTKVVKQLSERGVINLMAEGITSADNILRVKSWKLVEEGLANMLEEQGEIILDNEYGTWWGRTTGSGIENKDLSVIREIARKTLDGEY